MKVCKCAHLRAYRVVPVVGMCVLVHCAHARVRCMCLCVVCVCVCVCACVCEHVHAFMNARDNTRIFKVKLSRDLWACRSLRPPSCI
jgi:hypothetical protein